KGLPAGGASLEFARFRMRLTNSNVRAGGTRRRRHMQSLKSVLDGAAAEGIISAGQAGALLPYMEARGVFLREPPEADALDIAGRAEARAIAPVEDTEAPRFVRGFHDMLITIGVAIVMAGVLGIGSVLAALPVIVILAEI